jgi:hypothetical protein
MNPHIAALQDEQSSYLSVSKACLFFNQLATYGSSSVTPPSPAVLESNLFHVEEYATQFLSILRALCSAASHHFDRRCRILALNSLSIVSKAVVGKLALSPIYANIRDNAQHNIRLQDEICNDVVMNLISCALEDDDGVTTVALEALGRLIIDSQKDLFTREVRLITGDASPLTFLSMDEGEWLCPLQDLDGHVENSKIRKRILSSVVAPKIRHLFTRILLLKSIEYRLRSLPFLNEVVTFVYSCDERDQEYKHDKKSFASRWYELDTTTLVQEYVDLFLEPLLCLKHTSEGVHYGPSIETGVMTATYGLMMVSNARGNEIWIEPLMTSAVANLELALDNIQIFQSIEIQMEIVASLLVAIRRLNVEKQMGILPRVLEFLTSLPSTRVVPHNLTTGALYLQDGSRRRPVRCGYWTEVAVSFLFPEKNVDVMSGVEWSPQHFRYSIQYTSLLSFLESELTSSILKRGGLGDSGRKSVMNMAHEMIFVFCSVAHVVGNSIMRSPTTRFGREIWLASSLRLLEFFMPSCFGWTSTTEQSFSFHEGSSILLFAAQRAYVELLRTVLVHYGKIIPKNSIYYHFIMSVEHSQNKEELMSPWEINDILENDMSLLLDKIIQQVMNHALTRRIRLSILCLLSDAWIQHCHGVIDMDGKVRQGNLGPVDIDRDIVNIKERHVRNILSELGSEISKLIDGEKKRLNFSHSDSSDSDVGVGEELRSLLTCISCVESIAYAAQLCANHFMSSSGHADVEENSRYLVSISMLVLKGQGKVETDHMNGNNDDDDDDSSNVSNSHSPPRSPRSRARITAFTSECTQAAKRIRNFVGTNDDAYDIDGNECFSVDFNCLCPLLKRSNFGVQMPLEEDGLGDKTGVQYVNSLWKLVDRWTLIECDPEGMSPYSRSLNISILPFLDVEKNSKQISDSRVFFHLAHQQISYLVGYALVTRLLSLDRRTTNKPRYLTRESMHQRGEAGDQSQTLSDKATASSGIVLSHDITGCTDPLYATMSCSIRRCVQGLGQEDLNVVLILAVHNITPVHLERDLEMSINLLPCCEFPTHHDKLELMSIDPAQTFSPIVVKTKYSDGLKAKHHMIWEVTFDLKNVVNRDVSASILLPEVPHPSDGDKSSENTFNVKYKMTFESMVTEKQVLIPNPEVFYFGKHFADEKMFLLLWQNMPHSSPVMHFPNELSCQSKFSFLTELSSFEMNFESVKVKAWALASIGGYHQVLAVGVPPSDITSHNYKLHFKSSQDSLLKRLIS